MGAERGLALSFRPYGPQETVPHLTVVPPLLRREVKQLTPTTGDFVLVYLTHPSLSPQIIAWHKQHPELPLHCFRDDPTAPEVERGGTARLFLQQSEDVAFTQNSIAFRPEQQLRPELA